MNLNIVDVAPLTDEPTTATINSTSEFEHSCETCGIELTYGGRGRHPRFCADHKPNRSASTPSAKRGTNVDTLVASIGNLYQTVGMALSFYPPLSTDGMMVTSGAEGMAESWRTLLERDPKVRKMWERVFTVSGYGAVIGAHMLVLVPILQNHNVMPKPKGFTPTSEPAGL